MEFRKRVIAVLGILCTTLYGIYIAGSGLGYTEITDDSYKNKETIYFWYTDETLTDYVNSAAVAFGEKNNARVIPELVSATEYLEGINQASLHTEKIPDVYLIGNDSLEKAYLSGLATPVSDGGRVCNTEFFPQTALDAVTYGGNIVAYPYYFETSVMLYNKTYLKNYVNQLMEAEKAAASDGEAESEQEASEEEMQAVDIQGYLPKNMDQMLAFADGYDAPETVEAVFRWDVSDIFYNYFYIGNAMNFGGKCGDDVTKLDVYNEDAVACLSVYQNLNQFFYIEAETVDYESVIREFKEGKIVFTIATSDVVQELENAIAEGTFPYEYGVATVPMPSEELMGKALSVTNALVVNGYSDNKEAANEFAAFLATQYTEDLYNRCDKVSACLKTPVENPALNVFMEQYKDSVSLPKMIETSNLWLHLEVLFSKIWRGQDVETLLLELKEQMEQQVLSSN